MLSGAGCTARAHLSRSRLCSKFGSGRSSVHFGAMPRADVDDPGAPDVVRAVHGRAVPVQQTCGDGAFGVHAVFGTSHNGDYIKENARAFLRESFGASPAECYTRVGDPVLVQHLIAALWNELVKPVAQAEGRIPRFPGAANAVSEEGELVWREL